MQLRLHAGRYPLGGRPLNISVDGIELVADSSEETIISGGLRLEWSNTDDRSSSLWTSPLPASGSPRQLWVGGRRAVPARHPNTGYLRWESALPGPFARWGLIYEADAQLKQWAGDEVVGAHVVLFWSWTASRHRVVAHDAASRTLIFDRPSRQPLGDHLAQSGRRFFLEGFAAALDAPGEFAADATRDGEPTIMYMPTEADLQVNAMVESYVATAGLTTLLHAEAVGGGLDQKLNGSGQPLSAPRPLHRLRVVGLTFEHADWSLPPAPRMADWQAAAFLTDAAIVVRHVHGATFSRVSIRHVGGYALWLDQGATNCRLDESEMSDLGAGGVRIGTMELPHDSTSDSQRDERVSNEAAPSWATAEDGHETDGHAVERPLAVASHNELVASRIVDGGHVFREGVGVLIHRSQHNAIEENEIAHLGYTGVSLGWEWGYAERSGGSHNRVVRNFIHHIGRWELADMGGVYVLGRAHGTLIEGNVIAHVASYHTCAPPPTEPRDRHMYTCVGMCWPLPDCRPFPLGSISRVCRRVGHLPRRGRLPCDRAPECRAPYALRRLASAFWLQQHNR